MKLIPIILLFCLNVCAQRSLQTSKYYNKATHEDFKPTWKYTVSWTLFWVEYETYIEVKDTFQHLGRTITQPQQISKIRRTRDTLKKKHLSQSFDNREEALIFYKGAVRAANWRIYLETNVGISKNVSLFKENVGDVKLDSTLIYIPK